MLYLYIFAGLSVTIVAFFRRQLLVQERSFKLILACAIALFTVGILLHFTEHGRAAPSGALLAPLICLALYRVLRRIFKRRFHQEPRDTYLNWTPGLAADRVFNIIYFTASAAIVLWSMVLMRSLAKAGW